VGYQVEGIAVDDTYIYYTNGYGSYDSVERVPAAGGPLVTLASARNYARGIAVDQNNVYWAEELTNGLILQVPVGGGSVTTLASGQSMPSQIALDPTDVYWTTWDAANSIGTVSRVAIGGNTVQTLATTILNCSDLTVDGSNVYLVSPGTLGLSNGTVASVPLTGGAVTTLASNRAFPRSIAVDSTNVYWTSLSDNSVWAMPKTGGTPVLLASGPAPGAIVVDGSNLYWANTDVIFSGTTATIGNNASIMKMALPNGSPVAITTEQTYPIGVDSPFALAVSNTSLFWADGYHDTIVQLTPK
jgi:hypothetical protein